MRKAATSLSGLSDLYNLYILFQSLVNCNQSHFYGTLVVANNPLHSSGGVKCNTGNILDAHWNDPFNASQQASNNYSLPATLRLKKGINASIYATAGTFQSYIQHCSNIITFLKQWPQFLRKQFLKQLYCIFGSVFYT